MLRTIFFMFLLASLVIGGCIFSEDSSVCITSHQKNNLARDQTCFTVEIANTPDEHARGLMFRAALPPDEGMLFMFTEDAQRSFWMKNTVIPLDILFISQDFVITEVVSADPCVEEPCAVYTSQESTQYVLEINAGLSNTYGITAGDNITTKNI